MSRIIVKGLPAQAVEEDLRKFFTIGADCVVTDVRIVRKKDGTSRQMGFVGFKGSGDGERAQQRYHGGFLAGSKITVAAASQPSLAAARSAKRQRSASPPHSSHTHFASDAGDSDLTDAEYFAKRMKRSIGLNEPVSDSTSPLVGQSEVEVSNSNRLFLRNLSYSVTSEDILNHFSSVDPSCKVHLPVQPGTSQPIGIAFVTCVSSERATEALKQLDKSIILGRLLHVLPAAEHGDRPLAPVSRPSKSSQPSPQLSQAASGHRRTGLVMDQNAVLSAVAHRLKVNKSELMDAASSESAVKMALAETQLMAEAREHFTREGISLDALDIPQARSKDTLVVKNIPANTSAGALESLFGRHGEVLRVVASPSATIAFVRMADSMACQTALRNLAYQKLGSGILYVEKAPHSIWRLGHQLRHQSPNSGSPAIAPESATSTTLYIKNLPFTTDQAGFTQLFAPLPGCSFARLTTKLDKARPGMKLSAGFGFVGFATIEDAKNAMQRMAGRLVDGHAIQLSYANQSQPGSTTEGGPSNYQDTSSASPKVTVKNLPFETTKKDVRQLFSPYGAVKSVRVPTGPDGRSRGFGFVEFASKRDARAAIEALRHTHLLGRHLVLEYERADDTLGDD